MPTTEPRIFKQEVHPTVQARRQALCLLGALAPSRMEEAHQRLTPVCLTHRRLVFRAVLVEIVTCFIIYQMANGFSCEAGQHESLSNSRVCCENKSQLRST